MPSANDLITSYSFSVTLNGLSFSLSKVDNISSSIDIETIVSGGSNNAPIILRKPKQNPDVLVLERGIYTSMQDVKLAMFKEGSKISAINISVLRDGEIVRMFFIRNGVVIKREFSSLDSMDSSVMIQSMQIAHTGLTEVPLPFGL